MVDDEEVALKALRRVLEKDGHLVSTYREPVRALERLGQEPFDLLLTDLRMPHMDGLQLLTEAKRISPGLEVILITGYASVPNAIEAVKQGAFHYLAKPFIPEEVRHLVAKALEHKLLKDEAADLRPSQGGARFSLIVGESAKMRQLEGVVNQVAPTDCNVLIIGESGTGKELAARAIHALSPRRQGPFVAFNCGSLTEDLIANELFGHEKGAFTGADSLKQGLLETANRGTVFLDEIGDMPPAMQVKLLRVLQERELIRVGGTRPISLDVRVIAATARDLKRAAAAGDFRQDLFYRLNVVSLLLPRLAERGEDIPLLAYHFLARFSQRMNKAIKGIDPQALALLSAYAYPGNVREMENIIERAVALADSEVIQPRHLPADLTDQRLFSFREAKGPEPTLEELERQYVKHILERSGGSRSKAASVLGIDRASLWRKMKKYSLS